MCSYNALSVDGGPGIPTCAHEWLTKQTLRGDWGFDGYITSDSGALENIYDSHHYVKTAPEAACVAILQGTTDVCSGDAYAKSLLPAISAGLCTTADMDAALENTFRVRLRLGLFDPIDEATNPYWHIGPDSISTTAMQEFNLGAALSSMVLLKNSGSTLPFSKGIKLAVIGPHANASAALVGNYLGQLCPLDDSTSCVTKLFSAIAEANAGGATSIAPGCAITANSTSGFPAAVAAAQAADAVVLALGIDQSVEAEVRDRTSIDLPAIQHQLAAAIISAAAGKPVVIVLINGGMLDVSTEAASAGVGAILSAGYPGTMGADAIAATLFGENDQLGGRLPYTVYPASYVTSIKMSDMAMDGPVGRSYRYYNGPVVYPFGWGLSYANFSEVVAMPHAAASRLSPSDGALVFSTERAVSSGSSFVYSVNVTNISPSTTGDDVVMAYMSPQNLPSQPGSMLIKQLVDYQRVHLAPGESALVSFTITSATFRVVSKPSGDIVSTPGAFKLIVSNGVSTIGELPVRLEGRELVVERFPGPATQ